MIGLGLGQIERVLCLGAHADDIELGCGGTLIQLLELNPRISVYSILLSADQERAAEARRAREYFLGGASGELRVEGFRDSCFPYQGTEIKDFFHSIRHQFSPDLIFTHRREDQHQDHRMVAELTWNTFRDHLILEYEIPKYEGDLGSPNLFMPLHEATRQKKVEGLLSSFPSQRHRSWFCAETFQGLLRIRGLECNSPSSYAEGFTCRKLVLSL